VTVVCAQTRAFSGETLHRTNKLIQNRPVPYFPINKGIVTIVPSTSSSHRH